MSKYAKFLVAVCGVGIAVGHALVDGTIQPVEWGEIGTAVSVALGVFGVTNTPAA